MKIEWRPFGIDEHLQTILKWQPEHHKINFPGQHFIPELFIDKLKEHHREEPEGLFMLYVDGSEAGFLWLHTFFSPYRKCSVGDVHYVHLDAAYRGKKLGKVLMAKADEYFSKKGVRILELGTHLANEAAIRLYESFGYKKYRVIMVKEME